MRRIFLLVISGAMLTGLAAMAQAAATDTCAMSVTIAVGVGVDVTGDPLAFGSVSPGGAVVTGAGATVTNTGSTTQTYQLKITQQPAAWTPVGTGATPGSEQYKLLALFTTSTPVTGDFSDTDDVVTDAASPVTASATVYAKNGEGTGAHGLSCTATAVRKLWFKFIAPTSTAQTTQQFITVTVSAVQG